VPGTAVELRRCRNVLVDMREVVSDGRAETVAVEAKLHAGLLNAFALPRWPQTSLAAPAR